MPDQIKDKTWFYEKKAVHLNHSKRWKILNYPVLRNFLLVIRVCHIVVAGRCRQNPAGGGREHQI